MPADGPTTCKDVPKAAWESERAPTALGQHERPTRPLARDVGQVVYRSSVTASGGQGGKQRPKAFVAGAAGLLLAARGDGALQRAARSVFVTHIRDPFTADPSATVCIQSPAATSTR